MELRHLKSFVIVAETQSFSIAATRCFVTQSAVSQHLRALEQELGCPLLIRTARSVTLTESGEAMLPLAKEILRLTALCRERIQAMNNCLQGELRIGVGYFIAPYIRQAAVTFMERYPGVRLNAEFTKACRINQALREHKIDLAFTMNTAYRDEGIESRPCIPFRICAIMRDNHPLARKAKVTQEELLHHSVIMPDVGDRVFDTLRALLHCDLSRLNVKCVVSSPDEALEVVERTRSITFLPRLYISHRPSLTARPVEGIDCRMTSNAHWMRDTPMKVAAQRFLEIVHDEAVPYVEAMDDAL